MDDGRGFRLVNIINGMHPFDDDWEVETIEYATSELIPEIRDVRHAMMSALCMDNQN